MELDMSQEIGQILDEFALRFGATGAELWAELVQYQIATAISFALVTSLLLILFSAMCWWGAKKHQETNEELFGVPLILGGIGVVVMLICTCISFFNVFVTLAAPQAATLKGLFP